LIFIWHCICDLYQTNVVVLCNGKVLMQSVVCCCNGRHCTSWWKVGGTRKWNVRKLFASCNWRSTLYNKHSSHNSRSVADCGHNFQYVLVRS